jgi:hypothetical protein
MFQASLFEAADADTGQDTGGLQTIGGTVLEAWRHGMWLQASWQSRRKVWFIAGWLDKGSMRLGPRWSQVCIMHQKQ